jgi:hypothetical protein
MASRREKKADAGAARPGVLRIRTVAGVAQFRRCGRLFHAVPTDIPLADLSATERDRLAAEPMLSVEHLTDEV